jgi:hypothetical protein
MKINRRILFGAGAAFAASWTTNGSAQPMIFDPVPPLPLNPTPGKPGDFDFLTGEWRIKNRSIVNGAWLEYDSEATVYAILKGIGSVEELRIPARDFSGMGLRLLDVTTSVWSDFWVNAKSGVLTSPGQTGSFENGIGVFWSDYKDNGQSMKSAGVWDLITPNSCRWRQVVSADGGETWAHNWIMDWTRAKPK